ncbi:hypothetical protein L0244_39305, partial [bacterium]|nr:hypothetical protein [bacterium]
MNNEKNPVVVSPKETPKTVPGLEIPAKDGKLVIPATDALVEQHKQKRKYTRRQKSEEQSPAPVNDAALQVNIDLLKKSIHSLARGTDGFVVRTIHKKAKRITGDENLARELAMDVGMTTGELEVVSEATTLI